MITVGTITVTTPVPLIQGFQTTGNCH